MGRRVMEVFLPALTPGGTGLAMHRAPSGLSGGGLAEGDRCGRDIGLVRCDGQVNGAGKAARHAVHLLPQWSSFA